MEVCISVFKLLLRSFLLSPTDVLALHITHQNAGLIIRRQSQTYSFESFELSAISTAVMGTRGRLIRRFPGPVVTVPDRRVLRHNFRKAFRKCLASLESETMDDAVTNGPGGPGTHKDTIHPHFVTEFLSGILRGTGSPQEVSQIHKRTRDDVSCGGDGMEPWRRSPRWLLLKIATQSTIAGPGGDHTSYKIFMLHFLATVSILFLSNT